jgi:EAL domain-containing protein (putative c-di-GMP-specific phosphodiesterase class I)
MLVTAEGVESEAQFERLRQQGCDEMQGFFFGEPLPAAAFLQRFRNTGGIAASHPEPQEAE